MLPTQFDLDNLRSDARNWSPDHSEDYCPRCGQSLGPHTATIQGCSACFQKQHPWHRLIRLGSYQDPLRRRIHQLKFHNSWQWSRYFAHHLANSIPAYSDHSKIIITSVPLHYRRRVERGYNQAALIAKHIAHLRQFKYKSLIKRIKNTTPQSTLAPSLREANVRNAFKLTSPKLDLTNHHIILIDDVKTTGSTLRACSKILNTANAQTVTVAVIAVAIQNQLSSVSDSQYYKQNQLNLATH